jgi:hypothetical protein
MLGGEPGRGRPELSPARGSSRQTLEPARPSQDRRRLRPPARRSLRQTRPRGLRDRARLCGGGVAERRSPRLSVAHLPPARWTWSWPAWFRSIRSSTLLPSVVPRGQAATGSRVGRAQQHARPFDGSFRARAAAVAARPALRVFAHSASSPSGARDPALRPPRVGPAEAVARHLGWVPAGCAHGQVSVEDTSRPRTRGKPGTPADPPWGARGTATWVPRTRAWIGD